MIKIIKMIILLTIILTLYNKAYAIDLNYKNIPISIVIKDLTKYTDKNITIKNDIDTEININLKNVDFDNALKAIIQTQNLYSYEKNNIIFISDKENIEEIKKDSDIQTIFFKLKYSEAKDIEKIIKKITSEKGIIEVDERTNTIMLRDNNKSILKANQIVNNIDILVQQIEIEARIILTKNDAGKNLGSKLNISKTRSNEENKNNSEIKNISNVAANLIMKISNPTAILDIEIAALEKKGQANILAKPKITTSNKEEASIKTGTKIPYQSANGENSTVTAFKDAVMSLQVTPTITENNEIMLELKINKDSIGNLTAEGASIDTTEIKTKILVKNKETIKIGGIYQIEKAKSEEKVFLLGDIPLIGRLFRSTNEIEQKTELIIFITPKILN